jgi:hypothetical protein
MTVTIITDIPEVVELLDQFVTHDYSGEEYDDYWCISIKPQKCFCGHITCYAECGPHIIVIWKERDEHSILKIAASLKEKLYNPYITQYNRILGPCMTYEDAKKLGWADGVI